MTPVTLTATADDILETPDGYYFKREGYKTVRMSKTMVKDIQWNNVVMVQTQKLK